MGKVSLRTQGNKGRGEGKSSTGERKEDKPKRLEGVHKPQHRGQGASGSSNGNGPAVGKVQQQAKQGKPKPGRGAENGCGPSGAAALAPASQQQQQQQQAGGGKKRKHSAGGMADGGPAAKETRKEGGEGGEGGKHGKEGKQAKGGEQGQGATKGGVEGNHTEGKQKKGKKGKAGKERVAAAAQGGAGKASSHNLKPPATGGTEDEEGGDGDEDGARRRSGASAGGSGRRPPLRTVATVAAAAAASVQVQAVVLPPPLASTSRAFSSNWQAMKEKLGATGDGKRRREEEAVGKTKVDPSKRLGSVGTNTGVTRVIAMDCEMVGVGPKGTRSAIARVCIVNNDGNVLMDAHVKPKETVTDYRTWVSGVKPEHLRGEGVLTLEEAQQKVAALLKGAILVGHSLHNDLKALLLDHPRKDTRDTGRYPALMRSPAPGRKPRPRALRHLAREELGLVIQEGAHSPVDDARAALYIYHKHRKEWERSIATGALQQQHNKNEATRKVLRETLEARAGDNKGAARRARLGKGKGQLRLAQGLGLMPTVGKQAGRGSVNGMVKARIDPYNRSVKDDPYADL